MQPSRRWFNISEEIAVILIQPPTRFADIAKADQFSGKLS
jgi:hypothetical protein